MGDGFEGSVIAALLFGLLVGVPYLLALGLRRRQWPRWRRGSAMLSSAFLALFCSYVMLGRMLGPYSITVYLVTRCGPGVGLHAAGRYLMEGGDPYPTCGNSYTDDAMHYCEEVRAKRNTRGK